MSRNYQFIFQYIVICYYVLTNNIIIYYRLLDYYFIIILSSLKIIDKLLVNYLKSIFHD